MRKSRFAMRPQRNNPPSRAYFYSFSRQLLCGALAKLFSHLTRRMCPRKFSRISRVAQPFNFSQIFQTLLKLVLRFEFQRVNFLSAARAVRYSSSFGEPGGSIAVASEKRQENASQSGAAEKRWYTAVSSWGQRVLEAEGRHFHLTTQRLGRLDRVVTARQSPVVRCCSPSLGDFLRDDERLPGRCPIPPRSR